MNTNLLSNYHYHYLNNISGQVESDLRAIMDKPEPSLHTRYLVSKKVWPNYDRLKKDNRRKLITQSINQIVHSTNLFGGFSVSHLQ